MTGIRDRIELGFESMTRLFCRRRWAVIALSIAIAAGLVSGIAKIRIDMSNEGFLRPGDPILASYTDFKSRFGRDDLIMIAVESDDLFSAATLARLRRLHEALRDGVPHLADITSLVNARNTYGEGDRLVVEDLMKKWPETAAARARIKQRVMANPLYLNRLISADGRLTTVAIEIDAFAGGATGEAELLAGFGDAPGNVDSAPRRILNDAENRAAVEAVKTIVAAHRTDGFRIYIAGTPVVTEALKGAMQVDMRRFMMLAVVLVAVCLFAMFRRVSGVVLPLVVVAVSLVSTLGLMGHFGTPIRVTTVILPSFLLAVGVGASVHVLAMFFLQMREGQDRHGAIVYAMGHSGLAIVMTSLTTAAGLASFSLAEVQPIADLGQFAALGVAVSLIFTVLLLPALLAVTPVRPHPPATADQPAWLDRALAWVARFSTGNARAIVAVSVLLLVGSTVSAAQLRLSHNVLAWLPESWPTRLATAKVDGDLRGSVVLEVLVDTGRENGLYDREVLVSLDRLARRIEGMQGGTLFVGKATSVADTLQEIHQALNGNAPGSRTIPADPKVIPQEFLLFENSGSDDLKKVVDSRFQVARFSIKVPWRDTLEYVPFIARIEQAFRDELGGRATIATTGVMRLFSRTIHAAILSAAQSYVIALVVITLLMIFLVGHIRLGLAAMLPNLTPIVMTMGLMWWAGLPLNMFTMLVASVAIGLAVDDTIHFMHNFRRYYAESGDVAAAVAQTLHTTGRAMLITSVVLGAGFFIFLLATMSNVVQFGLLTGIAIVLALLADFLMAPALMVVLNPARHGAARPRSENLPQKETFNRSAS